MATGHVDDVRREPEGSGLETHDDGGASSSVEPPPLPYDAAEVWTIIAGRICFAGGIYGVLIVLAVVGLRLVGGLIYGSYLSAEELHTMLFAVCIAGPVCGAVGVIWAGIVSMFVMPFYHAFVRSLRLQASMIWIGAACGGLVGFVAVLPIVIPFGLAGVPARGSWDDFFVGLLLLPGATTVLGQIGGAFGGRRAIQLSASVVPTDHSPEASDGDDEPSVVRQKHAAGSPGPHLRFGIRDLMWITFWLCLLLAAIRLCGLPYELVLPLLAGWAAFQALTLVVGGGLVRRLWPRWQARRST